MEYLQGIYRISHVGTGSMCDFTIECPQLAQRSKAGQFVHIRLPGFTLRRPISICEVEGDSLRILFDVRGEGTRVMAQLREGDSIDVMGPLGNGFTLLDSQKKAVVVGGGIGVPPMLQTAKHYAGNATAILGFRDAGKIVLTQDFEKYGARVMLATDDGSAGHHGLVTDLLRQRLEEEKPEYLAVAFDVHAPTFRHKMYEAYKGTRKPMPEELREQVAIAQCEENESHFKYGFSAGLIVQQEAHEQLQNKK